MKKAPTGLSVCILKVLVYIALMIGSYHVYQDCPCQQHAEEILSAICGIEITLREHNEQTSEEEKRRKKMDFYFLCDGKRE